MAVNEGAAAIPLPLVIAVALGEPLNVALAPVPGALNVTVTPLTGLLLASFTNVCSPVPNAELTVPLCGVPAFAVTLAGGPGRFVKLKLAAVATPAAVAVTV